MSHLFSFFSGKPKEPEYPELTDLSSIGTDIHSHLIPGIDDGVKDMEESLRMIRGFAELGYRRLVTTPHIMNDYFRNTPEIILDGLAKVRAAVAAAKINMTIDAAAEYYVDEDFLTKMIEGKLLTIGSKYVLIEISYVNPPENLKNVVFEMTIRGFAPILAHPERYPFWYEKFDEFHSLKDAGVKFQLNINSLVGYYGMAAKKVAERMIDENMIEFVGSDLHGDRHLEALRKVIHEKKLRKLLANGVLNSTL